MLRRHAFSLSVALWLRVSAAPFSPGSFSAVLVGGRDSPPVAKGAEPVAVVEFSPSGAVLQTVPLGSAFALTASDEREGDLGVDYSLCALALLGYLATPGGAPLALGGTCPCAANLTAALVLAGGSVNASTTWRVTGNPKGGPGYVRANGLALRPDGLVYAFAGESGGCVLDLLAPGHAYDRGAPTPPGARRAEVIGDAVGGQFSARGLAVAGRERARLQLYAGSGTAVLRIGAGLPDGAARGTPVARTLGGQEGGAFEFASDTVLYVADGDDANATTARTLHRYICTQPPGATDDADDPALLPCPEGGAWALDPAFDAPCDVGGQRLSLWYIAGDYSTDPGFPTIYASTHGARDATLGDVGANVVVALNTRTGVCEVVLGAVPNAVWRGVARSPNAAVCAGGGGSSSSGSSSASPTPSAIPGGCSSSTPTPTPTPMASASSGGGGSATPTPSLTASVRSGSGGSNAGVAVGAAVGTLGAVAAVAAAMWWSGAGAKAWAAVQGWGRQLRNAAAPASSAATASERDGLLRKLAGAAMGAQGEGGRM